LFPGKREKEEDKDIFLHFLFIEVNVFVQKLTENTIVTIGYIVKNQNNVFLKKTIVKFTINLIDQNTNEALFFH
jgi:hypothetical protein